jgi:hypothetical protein
MADLYGVDVAALDDLPDPEQLVSEEENVAYALGRRLITPEGALEELGDPEPYDSLDLNEYFAKRTDAQERATLAARATRVLSSDPRVRTVSVETSFANDTLSLTARGEGREGPFAFVLSTDGVTVELLEGGA